MEAAQPDELTPAVHAAAQRLRVDSATAEVLSAFRAAGVESILLKGASSVRWLYGDGEGRAYGDCDLLLRPGDSETAAEQLRGLGFFPELEERDMPDWWQHAVTWGRADDRTVIDLHRTLPGVGVDAERLWSTLSAGTETLLVGGFPARVLPIPGRALHLALHAAQHGTRLSVVLADLELAVARADESVWRGAAELAELLGAMDAFAAGLRLVPAGWALAARLDLPFERATHVELRASNAPPSALTIEQLAHAGGLRARLAIVRHKVAPPATYMRRWSPRAGRNRFWLALAYARRPIWLLRRTPRALRTWRQGRRAARSEPAGRGARDEPGAR